MHEITTLGGCAISAFGMTAKIRGKESVLPGEKRDAKVCINMGGRGVSSGQFGVHITPDEARRMAAMLIASADEADQSEADLARSLAEAA